jgi:hypothetical protein
MALLFYHRKLLIISVIFIRVLKSALEDYRKLSLKKKVRASPQVLSYPMPKQLKITE